LLQTKITSEKDDLEIVIVVVVVVVIINIIIIFRLYCPYHTMNVLYVYSQRLL